MSDLKVRRKIERILAEIPVQGEINDGIEFDETTITVKIRPAPGFSGPRHLLSIPRMTRRYDLLRELVYVGFGTVHYTEISQGTLA